MQTWKEGADDPTVLEWAASEGRVLLTHDVNTLTLSRTNESKTVCRCRACLKSL
ncbi:MAG TPA: hypothetical protein VKN18_05735 [Blastocatellia bacterium]|nr:hypothetical protein [Blastocatellia bacterium]